MRLCYEGPVWSQTGGHQGQMIATVTGEMNGILMHTRCSLVICLMTLLILSWKSSSPVSWYRWVLICCDHCVASILYSVPVSFYYPFWILFSFYRVWESPGLSNQPRECNQQGAFWVCGVRQWRASEIPAGFEGVYDKLWHTNVDRKINSVDSMLWCHL